jgi:phosphinothricin acetyltransferase
MIRECRLSDASRICEIYNHFVNDTIATFELEPVSDQAMSKRIQATTRHYPWLVYEVDDMIAGYAYATQWKPRAGYQYSAESTVYVAPAHSGHGIGSALMRELLERLKPIGIHSVLAGIALPNAPSVALHEKLDFEQVAHFRETGRKFKRWIDVVYWERNL